MLAFWNGLEIIFILGPTIDTFKFTCKALEGFKSPKKADFLQPATLEVDLVMKNENVDEAHFFPDNFKSLALI